MEIKLNQTVTEIVFVNVKFLHTFAFEHISLFILEEKIQYDSF